MNHLRTLGMIAVLSCIGLALPPVIAHAADPSPAGASGSPGFVAPQMGLGAGPSQLVLSAGDTSGSFTVFNPSKVEESVTVVAYDFVTDSSGKRVRSDQPLMVGLAKWASFTPATFTLAPGQSQVISVAITRPADATPGDHYAVVEAGAQISDTAWKALVAQAGGMILRSRIAFPVTFIARVPGAIDNALSAALTVPSFVTTTTGEYALSPAIIDGGNIAAIWMPAAGSKSAPQSIVPSLYLANSLSVFGGNELLYQQNKDGTPASVSVLPGTTKTQPLTLTDAPLLGSYDYIYTLPAIAADSRADITVTGHFWIVNLQKVFLYIVLPLLVLILLLMLRVWQKRQDRRYRARLKVEAMQEARAALEREAAESRGVGPQGPLGPQTPQGPYGGGTTRSGTIR